MPCATGEDWALGMLEVKRGGLNISWEDSPGQKAGSKDAVKLRGMEPEGGSYQPAILAIQGG